jgi:hypothetical protein
MACLPRGAAQPPCSPDRGPRQKTPRWRGFAFDAPEQLGSSCVRQSNPSGVFLHRHSTGFTNPAAGRDDEVVAWLAGFGFLYPPARVLINAQIGSLFSTWSC